jgi:hypothetical protein
MRQALFYGFHRQEQQKLKYLGNVTEITRYCRKYQITTIELSKNHYERLEEKNLNKQEKLYAIDECTLDMQLTQRRISHVAKILSELNTWDNEIRALAFADSEIHEILSKYEKTAQKVESEFLEYLQDILELKQKYLKEENDL